MCATIDREFNIWAKGMVMGSQVDHHSGSASYYRVPIPGDPVTITGMRRRPELNGARGEIASGALDEHGRVTVRVYESTVPGQGGYRHMKIQPFRLVPLKSPPALPPASDRPLSR